MLAIYFDYFWQGSFAPATDKIRARCLCPCTNLVFCSAESGAAEVYLPGTHSIPRYYFVRWRMERITGSPNTMTCVAVYSAEDDQNYESLEITAHDSKVFAIYTFLLSQHGVVLVGLTRTMRTHHPPTREQTLRYD